jgi:RNA 3'-terminal phosphate cyclase (ATP)
VLSAVTGQGFELSGFRERRLQPGLQTAHLAVVRALGMACGARLHDAFQGSCGLRFEPGSLAAGEFEFDVTGERVGTLVLQGVLATLARANGASHLKVRGATHLAQRPSFHYLDRHWLPLVAAAGVDARLGLTRASFVARGEGEMHAEVAPASGSAALDLERRGALVAIRGVCGVAGLKVELARRMRDAAQTLLWEQRRLASDWDIVDLPAASAGVFAQMELVFERSRAAFDALGERSVRGEVAGERLARACLRFLDGEAAVDRFAADQLVVPMALSGKGGRVATDAVTAHLLSVAGLARLFGFDVRVSGAHDGPGLVEVACP